MTKEEDFDATPGQAAGEATDDHRPFVPLQGCSHLCFFLFGGDLLREPLTRVSSKSCALGPRQMRAPHCSTGFMRNRAVAGSTACKAKVRVPHLRIHFILNPNNPQNQNNEERLDQVAAYPVPHEASAQERKRCAGTRSRSHCTKASERAGSLSVREAQPGLGRLPLLDSVSAAL